MTNTVQKSVGVVTSNKNILKKHDFHDVLVSGLRVVYPSKLNQQGLTAILTLLNLI